MLSKADKETVAKRERAYKALMEQEETAVLYVAYQLVVGQSKEYAERVLNTPLAD